MLHVDLSMTLFQSTLPRGSDTGGRIIPITYADFNPRSLAGATVQYIFTIAKHGRFQSTLPRGSDDALAVMMLHSAISIHAPSRERLQYKHIWGQADRISIHAPSRERQVVYNTRFGESYISIHAPSRERLDVA